MSVPALPSAPAASSPLVDELHALRSALFKAQSATHSTSLQLHSASLQNTLTTDRLQTLEAANGQLQAELDVLRATPVRSDEAVELEEKLRALSLAHRKLSALADEADASVARVTGERVNEQAYRARAEMKLARLVPPTPPPKDGGRALLPSEGALDDGGGSKLAQSDSEKQVLVAVVAPPPSASSLDTDQVAALREELEIERAAARLDCERLAELEVQLDKRRRDDAAAAGVVERYMAFSQSSSLLLHGQLHSLRTRHAASLLTLLKENDQLRRELSKERREAERTRKRLGEVGEEAWIEAEGRRREIGLRLAAIGREERLMDKLRQWNTRVQAVLSKFADSDASGEIDSTAVYATLMPTLGEASQILALDEKAVDADEQAVPSAQAGRVYMAEELLSGAMEDLRVERERRRALEARLAVGADPDESVLEDGEVDEPPVRTNGVAGPSTADQPTELPATSTLPVPVAPDEDADDPLLASLLTLPSRHRNLQTRFADLNVALATLLSAPSPSSDDLPADLSTLLVRALTRLSDILEDARVELEISIDDERRVVESFRVLLALGKEGQGTKANELVRREVEEFVDKREKGEGAAAGTTTGLTKRAEDLEWDFAALKAAWINPDSLLSSPLLPMSLSASPSVSPLAMPISSQHLFPTPQSTYLQPPTASGSATPSRNPLLSLGLRTLQPASLLPPAPPQAQHAPTTGFRRSSFANLGRLFRDQPPAGPARSFSFQSSNGGAPSDGGLAPAGSSPWGIYRNPSASGSSLGLHSGAGGGLASPLETHERELAGEDVVDLDDETAPSEDEVE